jgi:hypothetical protein
MSVPNDNEAKKIEGTTFMCEVPAALGRVTKLEKKRGKIIARTESGQTMIVPTGKSQGNI